MRELGGAAVLAWPPAALALAQRSVFLHQQVQVLPLLVGELEKHLPAFGFLEPFAVALEEPMRPALALDADEKSLLVVDPMAEPFGAGIEQAARGALEEQERRPRFELRILGGQVAVALLEEAEMVLLFGSQLLEHGTPARVAGERGGTRVELETTPLGRDGHAERVAREHKLGRRPVDRRRLMARGPGL